ncbi:MULTISPECIES: hypothetical protein [Eisenbergiella]|uniref:hypothetical protein n=1 Tax=Eisenbergiella TaxID=1432051 RepID=UPI0023F0ACAA|nr:MULTISPECIES: hypothetical protein [Eisenbergiella]MCI6707038.1 hypothetical protein [Eisenbergiella massiliensis]MDY5524889.1 hypothetical protein [Eisenbergiella porci]
MKIISSQRYIDYDLVEAKIDEIKDYDYIILPIIDAGMQDLDGNDLFILTDGHHRKEAANELGIEIRYEEVPNDHNLTGEELLNECYGDSDWYYIENGNLVW